MTADGPAAIRDADSLDRALAAPLFVLLKHSPVCPVSDRGRKAFLRFAADHPDVSAGWIDVIDGRPLSQHVAAATGVRHESPQVLVLRAGRAAWNASHFDIRPERIADAVRDAGSD